MHLDWPSQTDQDLGVPGLYQSRIRNKHSSLMPFTNRASAVVWSSYSWKERLDKLQQHRFWAMATPSKVLLSVGRQGYRGASRIQNYGWPPIAGISAQFHHAGIGRILPLLIVVSLPWGCSLAGRCPRLHSFVSSICEQTYDQP